MHPSSIILVTGANGHVAQHIISQLLSLPENERPRIRATVRSDASAAGLKSAFPSHIASGTLEFAYIPEIAAPGAFDEAVNGVTHIAHVASPLVVGATDAENEVLKPAIQGTTSLLRSALNVSTLQSVVITSSFAAVHDPMRGLDSYMYTPKDWNPISYETAADPNLDLTVWPERYRVFITYMASKKLAEKAAWDFYAQHKPAWNLSVVCPTYIGGPNILPLARGAESLSFSQKLIWGVATSKPGDKLPQVDFPYWVDVRDVARVHILALQASERARGERFLLAPYETSYSRIADVLRQKLGLDVSREVQDLECFDVESGNCESVLGMKEWVPFEDMLLDTVKQVM